jgi:integrase
MRIGARGVGRSHGHRAAAFLPAPIAVPAAKVALAARRWCWRGGHRCRKEQAPCATQLLRRGHVRTAARCRRPPSLTRHAAAVPRRPRNKGIRYPADPPTVEEIVAVMRHAGDHVHGRRLRALIVVLWRAGLRIHEALALAEADLDPRRGSLLVRRGKGGRRREVGMDDWAWERLEPWLQVRVELPVGPLFCVVNGPTRGRPWSAAAARSRGRRATALRAAPATARARRRDGARGRAADRHPNASSDTPTSASRPFTCKASTTPRSSTPSTPAALR